MVHAISFADVCFLGAGFYLAVWWFRSRRFNPLPPGPPGYPVIGNLFQISSEKNWEDFAALGQKYGDIISISILGTRYIVLNSHRAISAILEKQSIKCSNRPHLTMACDLAGFDKGMPFMECSDRFRRFRKFFYRLFGTRNSTAAFSYIEEKETRRFLRKVLQTPDDLVNHIRFTAGAIILEVTYGYTVQEETDPFVALADEVMAIVSLVATPGAFLVDVIPPLRYLPEWFPGTGFLQDAKKYHQLMMESVLRPHLYVVEHMAAGTATPSFASKLLEGGVSPEQEDVIMTIVSCVLQISHGYTVKGGSDPFEGMAHRAMVSISKSLTPGYCLLDWLPILRYMPEWFPGCGFHKDAKRWRNMVSDTVDMQHKFVLEQLAKGDAVPSLFSQALQGGLAPEDEEILKWASFAVYLGGSEITPYILLAFFRAMTMYPEVQKKAQAEIDTIIGNDRLPTMEDRDALPYVNAICMEILRWNVVAPITVHTSTQDIIYEGYLIPKGSLILPNMWFILSDPETYPDPEIFDPDRFLGEHQQPDPREACFGWERRACPGERLAESMLFIYVAMALATLEVSRYIENGVEHVPRYEFEEGFLRRFKPFRCKITPRSKQAEDILQG